MAHKSKAKRGKHDNATWLIVAGIAALALLIFSRSSSAATPTPTPPPSDVQNYISGAAHVTFFQPDSATGAPQFSSADPLSVPPGQGLPAIIVSGTVIGAPSGYTLWRDQATGSYLYFPDAVSFA